MVEFADRGVGRQRLIIGGLNDVTSAGRHARKAQKRRRDLSPRPTAQIVEMEQDPRVPGQAAELPVLKHDEGRLSLEGASTGAGYADKLPILAR